MKECLLQARLAHKLTKDRRYSFPCFLCALHYVRTNWQALKGQISTGLLWKPKRMRRLKPKRIWR